MEIKAEINNENKAKFFALYWGQEIFRYRNVDKISPQAINIHVDHYTLNPTAVFEFGYIVLNPLSSNNDEDAEVIDLQSEDYDEDGWYDKYGDFHWWTSSDVDYLRSKGYALPWMGLSVEEMVEAGWIKLTTYKQKES